MNRPSQIRYEITAYRLPLNTPFRFGARSIDERRGLLLRATFDGAEGWGEAAPLPGFLDAPESDIRAAIDELMGCLDVPALSGPLALRVAIQSAAELVEGRDAADPQSAAAQSAAAESQSISAPGAAPGLALASGSATRPAARHDAIMLARAAVETALADLASRRADVPLAAWMCAHPAVEVRSNALLRLQPESDAPERLRALVEAGVDTLKIKIAMERVEADTALLASLARQEPHVRFRLDVNGDIDMSRALSLLATWAQLPIDYVEEPLAASAPLTSFIQLAARSPVRIAADERLLDDASRHRLIAGAFRGVFVLKPMFLGGPLRTLELAHEASVAGIACTVTTALDSAVGRAMAAATALAVEGCGLGSGRHGLATASIFASDVAPTPKRSPWRVSLGDTPGLGVRPSPEGAWSSQ